MQTNKGRRKLTIFQNFDDIICAGQHCPSRKDGDDIVIDVADNGPGIPEANLRRLFDPFFTTKAVGKGTGLGLSICYGIINGMGGDITVQSQVGTGTTFTVRFPIKRESEDTSEEE